MGLPSRFGIIGNTGMGLMSLSLSESVIFLFSEKNRGLSLDSGMIENTGIRQIFLLSRGETKSPNSS